MIQKLKNKLKNQKGFTLIELLAVIVILGILAAIAIPSINKVIQNSRVDAVKADSIAVYNAAKLYASQHEGDTDWDKTIDQNDLTSGNNAVLDDTSLTGITVEVQDNGSLLLTADGKAGSVTVEINKATYSDLNTKANWEANEGKITVPKDSTRTVTTGSK